MSAPPPPILGTSSSACVPEAGEFVEEFLSVMHSFCFARTRRARFEGRGVLRGVGVRIRLRVGFLKGAGGGSDLTAAALATALRGRGS